VAKVQLKNVRIAFPNLFDAKAVNGQGDPKFSASFLFAKNHPQIQELQKAVQDTATEKWGGKAGDVLKRLKAADRLCVHDGDSKSDYEGYAGNYFINASNKIRPLIIGGGPDGRAPLVASDGKPYSGCYVNVIVEVWAQANQFGERVNASLLGVQFTADGERLAGGSVAAADDFEALPGTDAAKVAATGQGAAALF
jgi:hypothetical protein